MDNKYDVAIVGTGIAGLAMAYQASQQGLKVVMFERNPAALGASIRNFGLIWPVGQSPENFLVAKKSMEIWKDLSKKAGFWVAPTGCLHLAYNQDELEVLEEFVTKGVDYGYEVEMMNPSQVAEKSEAAKPEGLLGGMYSHTELNIDPRGAIATLHQYLQDPLGVEIHYNTYITEVSEGKVAASSKKEWYADRIYICSGVDFETLYPQIFENSGMTKCKLQMMRTVPQPNNWQLGPSLCAGLTLQHYDNFKICKSLEPLKKRFAQEMQEYNQWGIHVFIVSIQYW